MPEAQKQPVNWTSRFSRIPTAQKIFFVDHLDTLIRAGIPLMQALEILAKETSQKTFQRAIRRLKEDVERGSPLSDAIEKQPHLFPRMYVKMVAAGEVSGTLEQSLEQIASLMKKSHALATAVRGAMIYPAVIFAAIGGIGLLMMTVVLPKLLMLFEDFEAELPLATRVFIALVKLGSNPIFLLSAVAVLTGLIVLSLVLLKRSPDFRKAIHRMNLRLPLIGRVAIQVNLAQFSFTLSSLLKSTIPIVEAVNIAGETCTNVNYRNALSDAAARLKGGNALSESLRSFPSLFPPIATEMIMVGEQSGQTESMLMKIADFYSKEVESTMKNFSSILEPVIIIILGIAVAGVALAVIMPMYTLIQSI
ncbi:MAG: hypothetical protein A3C90_01390 [Candidatus Magasanikbacteria bacterium RIFCSPHIGHO2_02_FULL_51_14]|uniref:Type II secretion system protein GspF domain-containing protein n=1 Tax=Candidatus Magasanikbacteria bacterium RIFCSPHIGHO2_02_FULL_51_14 TaxID=1798683 RepID=A0A1F6MHH5_9BACT|nr:MAG: hypothetical protein A3C90_01390 [Candidatus Magasanikbacteria bacterium RIFCSPHIGHO2_02_FULL_51_14]